MLRRSDYATSAADVVEATRLASSLASLRGRPQAGLREVSDAAKAVLGDGTDTPMMLLSNELVIGTLIGQVPAQTPMVPLARDLAAHQKRCRVKPQDGTHTLELDLRKGLDLQRSHLLHRLTALGVAWGHLVDGRRSAGTFRETWQMHWEPELEVRLIEASALGTTVPAAAAAAMQQSAGAARSLQALTDVIEQCLLADLADVLPGAVELLSQRAALDHDAFELMESLPPLARTVRYGDVRGTNASVLRDVLQGMVIRIGAGLLPACSALDDETAATGVSRISETVSALGLVGDPAQIRLFHDALAQLIEHSRVHGVLQGKAMRVLSDASVLDAVQVELRFSRALSAGTEPVVGAAFVEGFLAGGGAVLAHDHDLLAILDRWLAVLDADNFVTVLPLLRRTFAGYEVAERRHIGEQIRRGNDDVTAAQWVELDPERVAAGLRTMAALLGVAQ